MDRRSAVKFAPAKPAAESVSRGGGRLRYAAGETSSRSCGLQDRCPFCGPRGGLVPEAHNLSPSPLIHFHSRSRAAFSAATSSVSPKQTMRHPPPPVHHTSCPFFG